MRSVHWFPFDARRIVVSLVSVSSALVISCASSSNGGSKAAPVHCETDADCLNGQVCDGNVCAPLENVDTGAPSRPPQGTGGRSSTSTCGNGTVEPGEACDGSDFNGESCATATMSPGVIGTLRCTATCMLDLRGCRVSPDAGATGRAGAGGTFGFAGAGGSGARAGAGGTFGFAGAPGPAGGAGTGGTIGLSPPVRCGSSACSDPLSDASPSLISSLKQGGTFPSACCLDAPTSTCGTMFSGGSCQPIPPSDPTCPNADSSLPLGSTFPCCIAGACGLSLFGTPCMSLADLQGIVTSPPVACGSLGTGGFGAQP